MRLDAEDDARGDLRLRPLRGLCLRLTFRLAANAAAWRYAPTRSTSRRMTRHHECMRKWRDEHGRQTHYALEPPLCGSTRGDDALGNLRLRPLRGLCLRLTLRLAADAAAWRYAPTRSTSRMMPRHHECMRKWGGKHGRQTGIALRAYSSTSRRMTRHHECMREWGGEHGRQTVMARSAYIPHGWYNAPPRIHERMAREA